jgi:hypothetical protein
MIAGKRAVVWFAWVVACGAPDGEDLFRDSPRSFEGGRSGAATTGGTSSPGRSGGNSSTTGGHAEPASGGALAQGGENSEPNGQALGGVAGAAVGAADTDAGAASEAGATAVGGAAGGRQANESTGGTNGSGDGGSLNAGTTGGVPTGGAASCESTCPPNGTCVGSGANLTCECLSGFLRDGASCRRPVSCRELHAASPVLPSGPHFLRPTDSTEEFESYCEMTESGGGWTLVLNRGIEFEPTAMGTSAELAYAGKGTNLSYSQVRLESDIMLDVRLEPIASETYTARAVIIGVQAGTRGRSLRDLFTSGPNYLEAEDNSNLTVLGRPECNFSPTDLQPLLCQSCGEGTDCAMPVLVLGAQGSGCTGTAPVFAISGAASYSQPWNACAGWPQATVVAGERHLPDNIRVWIR